MPASSRQVAINQRIPMEYRASLSDIITVPEPRAKMTLASRRAITQEQLYTTEEIREALQTHNEAWNIRLLKRKRIDAKPTSAEIKQYRELVLKDKRRGQRRMGQPLQTRVDRGTTIDNDTGLLLHIFFIY